MKFSDFLKISPKPDKGPVLFEELRKLIIQKHPSMTEIKVWSVKFSDQSKSQGHFIRKNDPESRPGQEHEVSEIRYCRSLNSEINRGMRRHILVKELMHVFDDQDERVLNAESLQRLVSDIQNRPLVGDASSYFLSDANAHWKSLIICCPPELRSKYLVKIGTDEMSSEEVAKELDMDTGLMDTLFGSYYDKALKDLLR